MSGPEFIFHIPNQIADHICDGVDFYAGAAVIDLPNGRRLLIATEDGFNNLMMETVDLEALGDTLRGILKSENLRGNFGKN